MCGLVGSEKHRDINLSIGILGKSGILQQHSTFSTVISINVPVGNSKRKLRKHPLCRIFWKIYTPPPKLKIDTKTDGLEYASPFRYGYCGIYLKFQGCIPYFTFFLLRDLSFFCMLFEWFFRKDYCLVRLYNQQVPGRGTILLLPGFLEPPIYLYRVVTCIGAWPGPADASTPGPCRNNGKRNQSFCLCLLSSWWRSCYPGYPETSRLRMKIHGF